jgi:hypothetical protein
MHTFTIQRHTAAPSINAHAFQALNAKLSDFIAQEVDLLELGRTFGGVNNQYLSLGHLSLHPSVGLRRFGCTNVDELLEASGYLCGFMGDNAVRYALVPLGIVTTLSGLRKYGEAVDKHSRDGVSAEHLHVLSDGDRFYEDALQPGGPKEDGLFYWVSRFEQLFLGSGHTREMLSQGTVSTQLCPVSLLLSNGDTLLAYAYKVEQ